MSSRLRSKKLVKSCESSRKLFLKAITNRIRSDTYIPSMSSASYQECVDWITRVIEHLDVLSAQDINLPVCRADGQPNTGCADCATTKA